MQLTKVNCSRGAPMGRHDTISRETENLVFELEWMPLTDGSYDVGGAYWGSPANLYCAQALDEDGETLVQLFRRGVDRAHVMRKVCDEYPDATFLPENGSLVKQMIESLEAYLEREDDEDLTEGVQDEIYGLQSLLDDIKGENA